MRKTILPLVLLFLVAALAGCRGAGYGSAAPASGGVYDQSPRCANCGTVVAIEPAADEGISASVGTAIGAVVGGLVGSQVGSGSGQDAATAVGAVGGAVAGSEMAEGEQAPGHYEVTVDLDNGGTRVVPVAHPGGLTVGSRVEVVGNDLHVVTR